MVASTRCFTDYVVRYLYHNSNVNLLSSTNCSLELGASRCNYIKWAFWWHHLFILLVSLTVDPLSLSPISTNQHPFNPLKHTSFPLFPMLHGFPTKFHDFSSKTTEKVLPWHSPRGSWPPPASVKRPGRPRGRPLFPKDGWKPRKNMGKNVKTIGKP